MKLVLRICVSLAPAQPGYFFIYLGGRNAITKIFERATTKILCRAKKRQKEQKTVLCESGAKRSGVKSDLYGRVGFLSDSAASAASAM